ncbi:hypothetical protein KUCAC02_037964, partial [Chaenocephalus aceratus]
MSSDGTETGTGSSSTGLGPAAPGPQGPENCDRTGTESSDQQNRDMPIYHLPLLEYGGGTRARSKPVHVGSREDELLENWRAILGMGILETACGRPLFPAHSGLWRKCFCAGRDPDIDRLIDRGIAERCNARGSITLSANQDCGTSSEPDQEHPAGR